MRCGSEDPPLHQCPCYLVRPWFERHLLQLLSHVKCSSVSNFYFILVQSHKCGIGNCVEGTGREWAGRVRSACCRHGVGAQEATPWLLEAASRPRQQRHGTGGYSRPRSRHFQLTVEGKEKEETRVRRQSHRLDDLNISEATWSSSLQFLFWHSGVTWVIN